MSLTPTDVTGIGTAATAVEKILGMFFPDKTQVERDKMAQAFQVLQIQAQADQAQNAVNQVSAANGFTFRDGAGWVCVAGFAVNVLRPLISWGFVLAGHPIVLPEMDTTQTLPMLLGLLGLGGMHMNERIKGVA
jgi:hypothetical protein